MRIEYRLTPDDWGAFGEYCARTAPEFRTAIRMGQLSRIVIGLGGAVFLATRANSVPWGAACLVAAVVWAWYWRRHMIAHIRRHMTEREQPCLRGRHSMETVPEGIHAECDITASTVRWAGIKSVAETPTHIFLMLTNQHGYVIPKASVDNGNIETFVAEVRRSQESSRPASP